MAFNVASWTAIYDRNHNSLIHIHMLDHTLTYFPAPLGDFVRWLNQRHTNIIVSIKFSHTILWWHLRWEIMKCRKKKLLLSASNFSSTKFRDNNCHLCSTKCSSCGRWGTTQTLQKTLQPWFGMIVWWAARVYIISLEIMLCISQLLDKSWWLRQWLTLHNLVFCESQNFPPNEILYCLLNESIHFTIHSYLLLGWET